MDFFSSSSSFSKSEIKRKYDVFVNFRGEDTRGTFVSHLHYALSKAGVDTFLDDENLQKGMELKPELMRAIEGSRISLVVFSKTYTESTWCLDELAKIIECNKVDGQIAIPVFFHVAPRVVRHHDQHHDFGKALKATAEKRHSREHAENALRRWSHALTKAANFSGWDASNYSR
ncbi:Disease resistance protein RLM3 [Spatholobus suberectus]|nr:Disease resistance protein RLM3 [Spatholobus suberectus]